MVTGATRVAAVIGSPVRHSLSPALHNAAFAEAGLDWVFTAFEVPPGCGAAAVDAMRTLGLGGLAVTTPHKQDVIDALDDVDPLAGALRSVNTVVARGDGTTWGTSTDGAGFVAGLRDGDVDVAGQEVVVLGAGAAARAIAAAVAAEGAAVAVVNRTPERAAELVTTLRHAGVHGVRVGDGSDLGAAAVVVNATSVGMGATPAEVAEPRSIALPCAPESLMGVQVVADIVYHPLETPLLRVARTAGATCVDGLSMLVHQAALQQQLWTGVAPDTAAMRNAAEGELARRATLAGR